MLDIISWLIVGALAGWLGSRLMGQDNASIITDIVIGIVGAIIGGFLADLLGLRVDPNAFNVLSILVAVIGAMILIAIYRALTGGRRGAV